MRWLGPGIALLWMLGTTALGCGDDGAPAAGAGAPAPADVGEVELASAQAAAPPAAPRKRRRGRPLPAYQGWTLDQERVDFADYLGRRLVLFLFNPEVDEADRVAPAVAAIAAEGAAHNFRVLGVAHGSSGEKAKAFVARHGLGFPVVDDPAGRVAGLLGVQARLAALLVDAEGHFVTGATQFPTQVSDPETLIEAEFRGWLRLPRPDAVAVPELGERPLAPAFTAPRLDGGEDFDLASTRGRPLVLLFFLHTCPHCHGAMRALKDALPRIPEEQRPALVGISLVDKAIAVRESLKEEGLDFFPVVFDPAGRIQAAYGAERSVPVVFLVDAEGRIVSRTDGWRDERDPPLLRMRVAQLAGADVPMLLHRSGYSGDEFCAVCHGSQHETWMLTRHAAAFDTLVRHGADRNEECVGCHVVGFEKSGGYSLDVPTPHFENVGCETCHGRGGPHLSPQHVVGASYETVCVTCHDTKHSLGFDYASFVPQVSHAVNASFAGLSLEEKRARLAERRPRANLLPTGAAYVGSGACQSCHPKEYETWSAQPHARALESLAAKGEAGNADCLACHTTGYEREGGFPAGGGAAEHPDLAAVGCESCHGPGGDHVGEGAARRGSIVSLTDKCDSCVILKICGGCHDDANDPGFEFEVQEKIERQRHGTIAPSSGTSKEASLPPGGSDVGLLEEAFRHLDARG